MPANRTTLEEMVTAYEHVIPEVTDILQIRDRHKREIAEAAARKKARAAKMKLCCVVLAICAVIAMVCWNRVKKMENGILRQYASFTQQNTSAIDALQDLDFYRHFQGFLSAEAKEQLELLLNEADYEAAVKDTLSSLSRGNTVQALYYLAYAMQRHPEKEAYLQTIKPEVSNQAFSTAAELFESGDDLATIDYIGSLLSGSFYRNPYTFLNIPAGESIQFRYDPADYIEHTAALEEYYSWAEESWDNCYDIFNDVMDSGIFIDYPEDILPERKRMHCFVVTDNDNLRMRSGPGEDYSIVERVPCGEYPFLITFDESGEWALIYYNAQYGWASLNYLQVLDW